MIHFIFVAIFTLIAMLLFYRIVIHDDLKYKAELVDNINSGKIEYIWANGFICKVLSIVDDKIILVSIVGSEGDTPGFYYRTRDVKREVLKEDLILCNISNSDVVEVKKEDN